MKSHSTCFSNIKKKITDIEEEIIDLLSKEYSYKDACDMLVASTFHISGDFVFVIYDNYYIDMYREENGKLVLFEYNELSRNVTSDELIQFSAVPNPKVLLRNAKLNKLMK